METLCNLKLNPCLADEEQSIKLNKLHEIKLYMDAAVGEVSYCGNIQRGVDLYNYANHLLDKLSDSACFGCK
jgi:uncharacterized protein YqiB (DUF1249 family)